MWVLSDLCDFEVTLAAPDSPVVESGVGWLGIGEEHGGQLVV